MGGVYKEQQELDPHPTITNPSLLTMKSSEPISRKEKKLIVLHNFTSLKTCTYIIREIKEASTDIIVVSNELFCKDEIAKDFDKYFSRGCNIIEVTNLQPISIMQRIVYALLEKNSFVARDADHIVFTLLSEYSRGAATIVHLLTSLMQKNEDNSRTGFELVKQQLKLHIAHQKLERFLNSCDTEDTLSSDANENIATEGEPHIIHESDNCSCSTPQGFDHPGESFMPEVMSHNKKHVDVSGLEIHETSFSETPKVSDNNEPVASSNCASVYIQNESYNIVPPSSHGDDNHSIMMETYKSPSPTSEHGSMQMKVSEIAHGDDVIGITAEALKIPSSTSKHGSTQTIAENSKNGKQTTTADATQPLATAKLGKSNLTAVQRHPLCMYINDILSTTSNISLPAHHLINALIITGPISLPLFYAKELDNVVMNAVFSKERRIQAESLMEQLMKEGVIRNSCYPTVYHKELNPESLNSSIQPIFIPKLICDAIKDEMDDTDKVLSVLSAQRALENLLIKETKPNLIHLHYILILCNRLHDVCTQELHEFGDELLITNFKLKLLQTSKMCNTFKS